VVGEKFHEDSIRHLFPKGLASGSGSFEGFAHLVPEPRNRHDPNAIGVLVQGNLIGYLAKEQAARYVGTLSALMQNGHLPTTPCQVWAHEYEDWQGTDRRGHDIYKAVLDARASIVLDEPHLCVPTNMPPTEPHRLLPYGSSLQVKGEEEHLDVLAPLVSKHGEAWVYTTLHPVAMGSGRAVKRVVELRIDGQPVGHLTPAMSANYTAALDHLAETDRLAAARTLLKGNPIQVEAVLHAAKSHELDSAWFGPTESSRSMHPMSTPIGSGADQPTSASKSAVAVPTTALAPTGVPRKPYVVFQAPPGWPAPPDGWEPVEGWQPDPSWPSAPPGWRFWTLR
jgi:collagen type III alpha